MQPSEAGVVQQKTPDRLLTLAEDALKQAQALVRSELALAKQELRSEIDGVARATVLFAVSAGLLLAAVLTLIAAVVMAFGGTPLALLVSGVVVAALGTGAYFLAKRALPHQALPRTRTRLRRDALALTESAHG